MPRNSRALVPRGPTRLHERPPFTVRSTVPLLPLAHTTFELMGLIARRSAVPPRCTTRQCGGPCGAADTEPAGMRTAAAANIPIPLVIAPRLTAESIPPPGREITAIWT